MSEKPPEDRRSDEACCQEPHLVVIGGGSAAFAATLKAHELGARVTMINAGLPIGGTCVNVGCVPSKALIRAAEAHHRARCQPFAGLCTSSTVANFGAIMAQKTDLVETLRQAKYVDVVADLGRFERIEGRARVIDAHTVTVGGRRLAADRILIATGASPHVPDVSGLADSGYLTSTTALELKALPTSLLVLGGRYIALELAQMFSRFGTQVTLLQRSDRILPTESPDLTQALEGYLEADGVQVVTDVELVAVTRDGSGFTVTARVGGRERTFHAARLVAATGRRPNTGDMGLEDAGVELTPDGAVRVDDHLQTTVETVSAAGDVIGEPCYVYTAAYEGALAAANALGEVPRRRDYAALPWVVFTDPQVAGVGLDEAQARTQGIDVDTVTLPLSQVPRSLAARDTRGFVQLMRDAATDRLVGARILAPEGGELTMEVSLAIRHDITAAELARSFHPYLTLSEAVKLAALSFGKDVTKLSCCAA